MKDYYKTDEKFILNYEIKKNKIIIKFSNGEKWIGTKDNIDLVKSIMKMQVKEFDKTGLIKDEKKVKKLNYILTLFTVVGVFATLTVSLSNLLIALIIGVISLAGMAAVSDNISKLLEIKDSLKNIEFIENEELINEEIKKENVLINSSKKVKRIVSKRKEQPTFDINNIDKLSYNELKELLKVIETFRYLTSVEDVKEDNLEKVKKL